MTIRRLQAAMMEQPCGAHKDRYPIPPKKGTKLPQDCQWGHTVIEFADRCDDCAGKFLAALRVGPLNVAQRMHHMRRR